MVKKKGTNAADQLTGSSSTDILIGLGGQDTIRSFGASDTISGGDGKDKLFGGDGSDILYGHSSADLHQSESLIQSTKIANIGDGAVEITIAPGDNGFLYGLAKDSGIIYRIDSATGNKTKFLDVPDAEIGEGGERGVLGVTFDPDYAATGRFFVYMTNAEGNIEIREYARSGGNDGKADPQPVKAILNIPHPDLVNHNGGSMAFGPDGYLYIGTGDGGGRGDPFGNAQDKDALLGKILRIDINGDDFLGNDTRNYAIPEDNAFVGKAGADEIWALGMRNPWRFSFDTAGEGKGDFYIGDVGQDQWEEVNYVSDGSDSGMNFGWNYREGPDPFTGNPPNPNAFTDPVFSYSHNGGHAAISGGEVYHGKGGLDGVYIFSDFVSGELYTLRMVNGKAVDATARASQVRGDELNNVTDYGTDQHGNLYAVSLDGRIMLITPGKGAGDGADQLHGGSGDDKIYGGAGNDRLFGDAGADLLDGGIGNDRLAGGAGEDLFVFRTGTGRDTIVDFDAQGNGHDVIDLSRLAGIADFADLKANHMTEEGENVVIQSGGNRITLAHVSMQEINSQNFDFG
ncbi:MAG: hypothetical protein JWM58_3409 [Rhizobium sp.]|nr:hypothetical protein [Rhizobium sp.]